MPTGISKGRDKLELLIRASPDFQCPSHEKHSLGTTLFLVLFLPPKLDSDMICGGNILEEQLASHPLSERKCESRPKWQRHQSMQFVSLLIMDWCFPVSFLWISCVVCVEICAISTVNSVDPHHITIWLNQTIEWYILQCYILLLRCAL